VDVQLRDQEGLIAIALKRRSEGDHGATGTCSTLDKAEKDLGTDIGRWLEHPTPGARLGGRKLTINELPGNMRVTTHKQHACASLQKTKAVATTVAPRRREGNPPPALATRPTSR
jgi:hypothetical protein